MSHRASYAELPTDLRRACEARMMAMEWVHVLHQLEQMKELPTHRSARAGASISYLPSATMIDADDATLVRGLIDGDPRAAREAWCRFGPLVRRRLLRTIGPDNELEDLAQDVFITFFDRVRTLRDPNTLVAFILAITTFRIRHHLRWRWLRRWLVVPGQVEVLDMRTFEVDTDAREALVRFFRMLDKVNATDRTAFTLRFVEGMELREVATAMDMSLATIKRRLARTWKRLTTMVRSDRLLVDLLPTLKREPGTNTDRVLWAKDDRSKRAHA